MTAAHTPGPWFCEPGQHNHFSIFDERDSRVLARLFDKRGPFPQSSFEGNQYLYDGQSEANARLIAAAPDLLEAAVAQEQAEAARDDCPECDGEGYWEHCEPCSERFGHAIDLRRAAIAKATGQEGGAL